MSLTCHEYSKELKSIASDLINDTIECLKEYDDYIDADLVMDYIRDNGLIHNIVDGHNYVIYTQSAYELLSVSDNDNAYFDEMGSLTSNSFCEVITTLAFFAMSADLDEALHDELNDYDFDQLNNDE